MSGVRGGMKGGGVTGHQIKTTDTDEYIKQTRLHKTQKNIMTTQSFAMRCNFNKISKPINCDTG